MWGRVAGYRIINIQPTTLLRLSIASSSATDYRIFPNFIKFILVQSISVVFIFLLPLAVQLIDNLLATRQNLQCPTLVIVVSCFRDQEICCYGTC